MTIVDVAATITDAAQVTPGRLLDGHSMLDVAQGSKPGYPRELIQAGHPQREWSFRGVRDARWTYAEHSITGEVELYDRDADPYQLRNLAGRKPQKQASLAADLAALSSCAGPACYGGAP